MHKYLIFLPVILLMGIVGLAMTKDSPPPLLKLYNNPRTDTRLQGPPLINQQLPPQPIQGIQPGQAPPPPPGPPQTPPPPEQPQPAPPIPGQSPPPPGQPQAAPPPGVAGQGIRNVSFITAEKAIDTARRAKPYLIPGKVWLWREPGGEVVYKAGLVYQGAVIGVIEFDPSSGNPIPGGYKPYLFNATQPIENIKKILPSVVNGLQVLSGAEYRAPEACWIVPLAYKGMIVAHIKIYYDGEHVVPDYPANQEMNYYGR